MGRASVERVAETPWRSRSAGDANHEPGPAAELRGKGGRVGWRAYRGDAQGDCANEFADGNGLGCHGSLWMARRVGDGCVGVGSSGGGMCADVVQLRRVEWIRNSGRADSEQWDNGSGAVRYWIWSRNGVDSEQWNSGGARGPSSTLLPPAGEDMGKRPGLPTTSLFEGFRTIVRYFASFSRHGCS